MPSVHLDSDDGVSIRLVDVEVPVAELSAAVERLAQLGPAITATPTGAQVGLGFIEPRVDFADDEIAALRDVLAAQVAASGRFDQCAYGVDRLGPVTFSTLSVRSSGGIVTRFPLGQMASGMPSGLRSYWLNGEGAAKIGWGTGGDFTRCVSLLREHVDDPEGTCANLHRDANGFWPGDKANRGGKAETGLDDAEQLRFNPLQPRHPAGSPVGGQWSDNDIPGIGIPMAKVSPARTPSEELWRSRSNRARAGITILPSRADRDTKAGKLFGKGSELDVDNSLDLLFPEGALTAPIPFRTASRTKGEPLFDKQLVADTLAAERVLRPVDPRVLHATQPSLRRDALRYYLGQEYRMIGETFADQGDRGNIHPVVYKNPRGQWMLLSGHHRAAAALLRGEPLEAIVIDPDEGVPARRVGTNIPTRRELAQRGRDARRRRQLFAVAGEATLEGAHVP